ncbi:MAG: hypothetical protein ABFS39_18730 [Pseudomonadota bacterium]
MRRSAVLLLLFAVSCVCILSSLIDARIQRDQAVGDLLQRTQLVKKLGLSDLALFTEARYTRHLSQADLHTAFQDHPLSLEHFPSGSLISPPQRFTP